MKKNRYGSVEEVEKLIQEIVFSSKDNIQNKKISKLLKNGNYLFEATSPGKVPGSSALYQKWVNPQGQTINMSKTTYAPTGDIIHIKPK